MGTFAFGAEGHRQVVSALADLRPFERGGLSAKRGGCTRLNRLPRQYGVGLSTADYVVYCYDTPIAWVANAEFETDGRTNFMPDWQYSATTTYYQTLVAEAWGESKLVDPDPRFSRAENRGTRRGRTSDERYGRVSRTAPSGPPDRFVTNHRGVRYDALVERDTSYERDMVEGRSMTPGQTNIRQPVMAHPQETEERYQARRAEARAAAESLNQTDWERRRAALLDPRYADPDWTPFESLGAEADQRDWERVQADQNTRYPAHP